jgi:hypothetical protein
VQIGIASGVSILESVVEEQGQPEELRLPNKICSIFPAEDSGDLTKL